MDARFDLYDLPAGHEERFLEKWDAAMAAKRRKRVVFRWTTLAAAAAAVAFLLILPGNRHFFGARTPEAVYCAYLDQVSAYYELLAENESYDEGAWEQALASLTDETIPLFDQLPEDMPDRQKTRILKQYYGELLDGAKRLQQEWNN